MPAKFCRIIKAKLLFISTCKYILKRIKTSAAATVDSIAMLATPTGEWVQNPKTAQHSNGFAWDY